MSKTLGGTTIIRDGIKFDYNFQETIQCLLEFCDQVVVVDGGSTDGTSAMLAELGYQNPQIKLILCAPDEWTAIHGKQKLVHFTDIAISHLETDWNFYLQCDEILHEKSYDAVRQAIEGSQDSYMCRRINLWKSPFLKLAVPQSRMPCSEIVCRLAERKYKSYGDAESLQVDGATCGHQWLDEIRIYHMGFVRRREIMKPKIINMQETVFSMEGHDPKLDVSDLFDPDLWFSGKDLTPITEPLPHIMQKWALDRL